MIIERIWAMPNKWTFTIKPIRDLIASEITDGLWIDPFCGENSPAQIKNDLNPERDCEYHMEALEFLATLKDNSADGALFDPPYSPRQVQECYQGIGKKTVADHTRMDFWTKCKDEIHRIVKPGGKVMCFGWNSMGLGKTRGWEMTRILLVPHGVSKNDTICTVEIKLAAVG